MGGYLGFTGTDAHAWVEAWVPRQGWRWIDATPEERRWRRSQTGFFTRVTDFYDALNRIWYDNVVDYESKHDVLSIALSLARASRASGLSNSTDGAFFEAPEKKTNWFVYLIGIVALIASLLAGLLTFRMRRMNLEAIGQRLRELLGDVQGRKTSLEDLLAAGPQLDLDLAHVIVQEYQTLRFGPEIPPSEYRSRCGALNSEIRVLKQTLESD